MTLYSWATGATVATAHQKIIADRSSVWCAGSSLHHAASEGQLGVPQASSRSLNQVIRLATARRSARLKAARLESSLANPFKLVRQALQFAQVTSPYWTKRFAKVSVPFELRLLSGMNPGVPEVTLLIHKITKDRHTGRYLLHIKKVLGFRHRNKRRQKPKR
jgi:hypothetical protein